MFLPFSPGVYIALILDHETNIRSWMNSKQEDNSSSLDISEYFESLQKINNGSKEESKYQEDNSGLQQSQQAIDPIPTMMKKESSSAASSVASTASGASVKKVTIVNKLFLDLPSLSKNMQALLNNYEMLVIAQVKNITEHT